MVKLEDKLNKLHNEIKCLEEQRFNIINRILKEYKPLDAAKALGMTIKRVYLEIESRKRLGYL